MAGGQFCSIRKIPARYADLRSHPLLHVRPLLFSFKQYRDHLLTDGAILSEDALFDDWQKDGTPSICFRLRSEAVKKTFIRSRKIGLPQYVGLLIRTFMNAVSREYVHNQYWHKTLIINTGSVSAVDFKMDEAAKQELFNVGYQTTKDFLPQKLMSIDESATNVQ